MECRVKPGNDEDRVTIMANNTKIRAAVLGASGYTGADLIRLAARHPNVAITALIAKGHAGQALAQVFPHLSGLNLPALVTAAGRSGPGGRRLLRPSPRHCPCRDREAAGAHQGGRYVG